MSMRGTTIVAALFAAGAIMATSALAQDVKTDTPAGQEAAAMAGVPIARTWF